MSAIGLFDSGLGGLTVASAVRKLLPSEDIVYVGDSGRCPYGPRPAQEVREFSLEILGELAKHQVKLAIVACNTATAALIPDWPTHFPFPVVGVIAPGARAAVAASHNGRIGLIATEGTVRSGAYTAAVRSHAPGAQVFGQGCPRFVAAVEAGLSPWSPEVTEAAREYIEPLVEQGIDTLILGCTHFPHLAGVIAQIAGPEVRLVDPAEEAAAEAKRILAAAGQLAPASAGRSPTSQFFTSGDSETFRTLGNVLWPGGVTSCQHIDLR